MARSGHLVQCDDAAVDADTISLTPVGVVRSALRDRDSAPKQADENAPAARVEVRRDLVAGLDGLQTGVEILLLTWLHRGRRDVLRVHPRGDRSRPETGVFATRSPDRPNPIGLHRVRLLAVEGSVLVVRGLEAIDGTPVVDIKPVLEGVGER
jgi:tRNA-Thr(GGU) m(6)t(6)A37 methyltransferase TsaA